MSKEELVALLLDLADGMDGAECSPSETNALGEGWLPSLDGGNEMMITRRMISALLIGAACQWFAGCRKTKSSPNSTTRETTVATESRVPIAEPQGIAPSGESSGNLVIGHLKTRDKFITIRSGADGPLYTIKSDDGTVLAVDIPSAEISGRFPDLKDVLERGIAGTVGWAGM